MPFQLSPGVNVTEVDLTTVVPAVATTDGAIAGIFHWGPVGERVLIDSEVNLSLRFGRPTSFNAETWFTAANFLSYGNRLYVARAANTTSSDANTGCWSAYANVEGSTVAFSANNNVRNAIDYENKDGSFDADILYLAKYPGKDGNSLKISICDNETAYQSSVTLGGTYSSNSFTGAFITTTGSTTGQIVITPANGASVAVGNTYASVVANNFAIGDYVTVGNSTIGIQYLKLIDISNAVSNSTASVVTLTFEDPYRLAANTNDATMTRNWEFFNVVDAAPGQSDYVAQFGNTAAMDELHVVVVDEGGKFTGSPGTILEVFRGLSRAIDAKSNEGATIYYKTVINETSKYIWWANDSTEALSALSADVESSTNEAPITISFTGGNNGYNESSPPLSVITAAYDLFQSVEDIDISLVLQGKPIGGTTVDMQTGYTVNNFQLANYIIDNICETRKDCIALITPDDNAVKANPGNESAHLVAWRNALRSTSYAVLDSGYKYQYDKYNDMYRYVPLNGDVAGLCVRTDITNDPWWSPGGFNRGQIKNIVKLRYNPRKADRDILYKNNINPIVTFPGQGTVLFGDKTLLTKPSAFDRINVRRLFIVLEKAIAQAAKYTLFEFNDTFTRAQFKNLVTPYLRDVQGRRGITDFKVVCDETNNTPERIDRNEFWGDIYIKPARSINFIQLNFVAVRTGVQFSEVVGKF
jgi:Phage tail sheath protein subtilisin-like domain/Phage tail sheath C-terminal domain